MKSFISIAAAVVLLASSAHAQTPPNNALLMIPNGGSGGGAPSGAAGGDLTGTYPNPTIAAAARLGSKVIAFSRDISLTSSQAVTGCGFRPTALVLVGMINSTATVAVGMVASDGSAGSIAQFGNAATQNWTFAANPLKLFAADNTASNSSAASVSSFDADGFTLAWSKTGAPTGTANIYALCMR